MTTDLLVAVAATLAVGLVCALVTLRVARRSLRWATILSPVSVVLAIGAGLLVGVRLMLIEGAGVLLAILGVTAPVALAAGIFISTRSHEAIAEATAALEEERQRREVEQARRELIAGLSHDLRTPLAGIRAMGEALEDGIAPDPAQYHHAIVAEADRTAGMVDDLLSLAQLQSGRAGISVEAVSMADLVSDMIEQLRPLAASRTVTLTGETDGDVGDVDGDAGLLTRALQNTIGNALLYTRPSSTVAVRCRVDGALVRVEVTDECGGLSDADLEHMFEAGWRGDAARTPAGAAGSGLGLPIVSTIMAAHGGSVHAASLGHGCRVTLEVPRRHP